MANTCTTRVTIEGKKEVLDDFIERLENCDDGRYPSSDDTPHIVDEFGAEADSFIDRVGSKWVTKDNYIEGTHTCMVFGLESAWYPPSDMLKEMHRQLVSADPDIIFTARHWDENYDPIGVIKITDSGQYLQLEQVPMSEEEFEKEYAEDIDERNYWEDEIEWLFEDLERRLNK